MSWGTYGQWAPLIILSFSETLKPLIGNSIAEMFINVHKCPMSINVHTNFCPKHHALMGPKCPTTVVLLQWALYAPEGT